MSKFTHWDIRGLTQTFGAEIRGVRLVEEIDQAEVVEYVQDLMAKYRYLVFKNQGKLSGIEQVNITTTCCGNLKSTFSKHPKSPHPDVFRVSNNPEEGCTQVGRSGWHIDGTFELKPFRYQTMHFHGVIPGGDTLFVPLKEFFKSQSAETQAKWANLYMITKYGIVHPLVCNHPTSGEKTMVFHCGPPFVSGWMIGNDSSPEDWEILPGPSIQNDLTSKLDEFVALNGYRNEPEVGDFGIIDNLALAHFAVPGTQAQGVGNRILHRTTTEGLVIPTSLSGVESFQVRFR